MKQAKEKTLAKNQFGTCFRLLDATGAKCEKRKKPEIIANEEHERKREYSI